MGDLLRIARLIDCPALAAFADRDTWFTRRDEIQQLLGQHLGRQSTHHWLAILEPADVWCADVLDYARLLAQEAYAPLADGTDGASRRRGTSHHPLPDPHRRRDFALPPRARG